MQEIVNRTNNLPSTEVNQEVAEVLRSDIILPYLTVAQAMSEAVAERKAQIGDIIRTTDRVKYGDPDKPVDIIFLGAPATKWIYENKNNSEKWKFHHIEARTASNEVLPWYFFADEDGNELPENDKRAIPWRRVKQLLAFAILPEDIAAAEAEMKKLDEGGLPDPSKALTPLAVSFRSTSYNAGKDVSTLFTQAKSMRTPIWRYQVQICCKQEKNDDGTFYVWTVDRAKPTAVKAEFLDQVKFWAEMLSAAKESNLILVPEEDAGSEASPVQARNLNTTEVC